MAKEMNFIDRDVSWMYFNHRILEEARKESVPVLERMNFLGIYSNNLDEFFRVRMACINRTVHLSNPQSKAEEKEMENLLKVQKEINKLNALYSQEYQLAVNEVVEALRKEKIDIIDEKHLDQTQRAFVESYYRQNIMGRISPIWIDGIKHFDNEEDDTIYFIVRVVRSGGRASYAIMPLPIDKCGRWVEVPADGNGESNVMYLDDVVRTCLYMAFPGIQYESLEAWSFKFTRDAEMEIDNDLRNGLMQKVQKGVKSRKAGTPLRMVYDENIPEGALRCIKKILNGGRSTDTAIKGGRYHNHKDFMKFPDCGRKDLKYPKWSPILPDEFNSPRSIFEVIQEKDRFLHVPYHSFDGYIRLLNEAAINPRVKSIKTTLYRLARDSKVIGALICAAQNGKKVTVVIELFARFDEASNINWSKKMQDAGINVVFGIEGLKIHSKITHIKFSNAQSIACISTGNFHEGNARAYTDMLLFTANRNITDDVEKVFKFIEKPYSQPKFKDLLVSPNDMKKRFLQLIDQEIKNHLSGKPAYIRVKINHVTEPKMVQKIYDAAKAGVKVDMLVRGNCSLTDISGARPNLWVKGIIDRYLEHARIFIFCNGGEEKVFLGSADWMTRNLDSRIEVVTPVYDSEIKEECRRIVEWGLRDTLQGHQVIGTEDSEAEPFRSQQALYDFYNSKNRTDNKQRSTICNESIENRRHKSESMFISTTQK